MTGVELIITALATGAAAAAKDTVDQGIKDCYAGCKELIKKKFANNEPAKMILDEHEKDPETYKAPLQKQLEETAIAQDEEVIKAAQELLKKLEQEQAAMGKYNIKVSRDIKGNVGDISGGNINQTIN